MNFKIIEKDDGYLYKGIKYKWGAGLIEFLNYDFSNIIEKIDKEAINYEDNINEEINYYNAFKNIVSIKNSSIHFKLIQDLLDFPTNEIFDEPTNCVAAQNKVFQTLKQISTVLFSRQNTYKNILDICFNIANDKLKMYTLEQRLYIYQQKYENLNENFDCFNGTLIPNIQKSITEITFPKNELFQNNLSLINQVDLDSIINEFGNKRISVSYEKSFFSLDDFFRYELLKMIKVKPKICKCLACSKFFIADDLRKRYCSKECKNKSAQIKLNSNPFYTIYDKRRKCLYNKYSEETSFYQKQYDLRELFNEYKNKDFTNQDILSEYKKKITSIK